MHLTFCYQTPAGAVTKHLADAGHAVTKQVYGGGPCLVTVLLIRARRLVTATFNRFGNSLTNRVKAARADRDELRVKFAAGVS